MYQTAFYICSFFLIKECNKFRHEVVIGEMLMWKRAHLHKCTHMLVCIST